MCFGSWACSPSWDCLSCSCWGDAPRGARIKCKAMKAPRSKLRGIKTPKPATPKQLYLDVLTVELLIRLFATWLLAILAYDFCIAMTPDGTDKVASLNLSQFVEGWRWCPWTRE